MPEMVSSTFTRGRPSSASGIKRTSSTLPRAFHTGATPISQSASASIAP